MPKIKTFLGLVPKAGRWLRQQFLAYWRGDWWHKAVVFFWVIILLSVGTMYGIGRWYIQSERSKPLELGVSFIPDYASSLGVSPEQTMDALIGDLHVKYFRLTSYWSDIEPTPGHYNFSQLDWEFKKAEAAHAKITLAIGLRQPRWPECHAPGWVNTSQPDSQWLPELEQYMTKVIERYKNSPALQSYQLENEYFIKVFGECNNFDRSRLVKEAALVKRLDPHHPLIISRSNNAIGFPLGQPQPDEFGISIYQRMWTPILGRYFQYPFPAWYYAFLAGTQKIFLGKDMIVHEMQAEPWPPHGQPLPDTSLSEQNKSFNASDLKNRVNFAKSTGMRQIYLWGAEYWYYRKELLRDSSVWNAARQEFGKAN